MIKEGNETVTICNQLKTDKPILNDARKIKQREFIKLQLSPNWGQLKLESADGKKYATDCVNTKKQFS